MSNVNDIYINDTLITPFGREFSISPKEISKEDRTASGRLVKDYITTKNIIKLTYEIIDGAALRSILALYDLHEELTVTVNYETESITYKMIMRTIDRTRILAILDGLWGNVTIELEQV